jgi:hypothetical protein
MRFRRSLAPARPRGHRAEPLEAQEAEAA